jgi:aspartyl-tRNA(Asn)/glutamyl-tRNA(Gln) amidotransferase subunit A
MSDPADLGVQEAADLLQRRSLSARELAEACLARIRERDGEHSHLGDPGSINAWVRVYEEDALAAAGRADDRLARGGAPRLCGIPIGLKDLYEVAGKPVTASSSVLHEVPARDCDAWARLAAEGMVLLGHLHTHEFAAGGTTDQVGNPWALDRSAGGSSGGSGAALAARTTPAATGTDTAGSLRIPSSLCGTSTVKPSWGLVPIRGLVPLSPSFDNAGPMARSVVDCEPLLAAMAGLAPPDERRPLRRVALSPRIADLDPDVADGLERALALLPVVDVSPPDIGLDLGHTFLDLVVTEMLAWHRRFDDRRAL